MPSAKGLTELWLCMAGAYPHRWTSSQGELPVNDDGSLTRTGAIWQRGLVGVDDAMVRRGFEACILRPDDWPPTLPAFRRMAMGIPSLAQVKADLRNANLPHERAPFTRLVWSYIDHYEIARATTEQTERIFRAAFELAVDYVERGGSLPEPSQALAPPPPQPRTPAKPETVAACTDEINRWLRMGQYAEPEQEGEVTAP